MFKAVRNSIDNPWWRVPVTENSKLVCNARISDGESAEYANSRSWNASTPYRLLAPRTCLRQDGTLCLFFTPAILRLLLLNSGCEVVHASLCCVNPPPGQHRIYINARGVRKSRLDDWITSHCHCHSFIARSFPQTRCTLPTGMYYPGWCPKLIGQGQIRVWIEYTELNVDPINFFKNLRRRDRMSLSSLKGGDILGSCLKSLSLYPNMYIYFTLTNATIKLHRQ